MKHDYKTPADCDCVGTICEGRCNICDGGLALCKVCGGAEGSLPKECPGSRMTSDQEDAVYAGTLDFVGGKWVTK